MSESKGRRLPQFRPSMDLGHTPVPFWMGLAIGLIGLIVHVRTRTIVVDDSGYSCTYHEYSSWIFAALVLFCAGAGWLGRQRLHVARRLAVPLMLGWNVVLIGLAAYFVLRGLGAVDNGCAGHPTPDPLVP